MPTTTTGLATSFITFSRPGASGGGATTTDRDGKIKWAGHNLLLASESFDSSSWTKSSAPATANAAAAPDGTTTADRLNVSASGLAYQSVTLLVGVKYKIAVWAKSFGGTNQTFALFGDNNIASANLTATATWQLFEFEFTVVTGGARNCGISTGSGNAAFDVLVWGAHLYRSDLGGMQLNPAMPAGMQSYYPTTPRNLLGYSEDFSNNAIWGAGAYGTANSVVGPNGLQTADTIAFTAALKPSISQTISSGIVGGSTYTISVWAKASATGTPATSFRITTNNTAAWSTGITQKFTLTSSWQRFSITGVVASSGTAVRVLIGATNLDGSEDSTCLGSVDLYGAQLSDSASLDTYVPVYGAAVTSAAYYAPRLDFDGATLAAKGLLVEEARTNVLQRSHELSTSPWAANQSSISASGTAPDGVSTSFVLSSSGSFPALSQTVSGSGTVTFSAYVKDGTSGQVIFRVTGADVGGSGNTEAVYRFTFSTATFARVQGGTGTTTVQALSNNWYRIALSLATTTYSSVVFYPRWSDATAVNVLLWGAQLEAGSFATSYIPTGSATATRAADVASVSTQAFPYSDANGSIVVSGVRFGGAGYGPLVVPRNTATTLNDRNPDMSLGAGANGAAGGVSRVDVVRNGSVIAPLGTTTGTYSDNTNYKVGYAYATSDFVTVVNGGTANTQASGGAPPSGINQVDIGHRNSGAFLNGWIRQITMIPRRLSNAELASRTAA